MKASIYNITIHDQDKDIVYNTLTGNVVRVKPNKFTPQNTRLLELGFFVEENNQEYKTYMYKYMSCMFRHKGMSITIATTLNCNLSCPYCFEQGGKCKTSLSESIENAIVLFIKKRIQDYKSLHIIWFGGEPLLNPDSIIRISEALTKEKIAFTSSIVSNGTVINSKVIKAINTYSISTIQITIDGIKEVHDKKRMFNSGKGTFDIIIDNISYLLKHSDITVIIKTNIDKQNMNSYQNFKQLINEKFCNYIKCDRIKFSVNYVRDRTGFDSSSLCFTEKAFDIFNENVLKIRPQLPTFIGPCPMRCLSSYIIGPDGNIYKCLEHLGHLDKSIGNISEFRIRSSRLAQYALLEFPFENEVCKKCAYLPICGGGCPTDRFNSDKDNKSYCDYIKEKIKSTLINLYVNNENTI